MAISCNVAAASAIVGIVPYLSTTMDLKDKSPASAACACSFSNDRLRKAGEGKRRASQWARHDYRGRRHNQITAESKSTSGTKGISVDSSNDWLIYSR
jgi:hypothetical protein